MATLVVATLALGCGRALAAPGPAALKATGPEASRAVAVAHDYVRTRLDARPRDTYAFRSERDRSWMLVDGFDARSRPWAVFLHNDAGAWRVRGGGIGPEPAPAGVPCDIRYPFSEPGC